MHLKPNKCWRMENTLDSQSSVSFICSLLNTLRSALGHNISLLLNTNSCVWTYPTLHNSPTYAEMKVMTELWCTHAQSLWYPVPDYPSSCSWCFVIGSCRKKYQNVQINIATPQCHSLYLHFSYFDTTTWIFSFNNFMVSYLNFVPLRLQLGNN